jgi:hypothetical protein
MPVDVKPPHIAARAAGKGPKRRSVANVTADAIEKAICGAKAVLVINSLMITSPMKSNTLGKKGAI